MNCSLPLLGCLYWVTKSRTLGKWSGIKWGAMGNTLGTTKVQKLQHHNPPQKKKTEPIGQCWLTSLAVKNFYAYLPLYHFWHRLMGRGTNNVTNSCFLLISWWMFTQSSFLFLFSRSHFDWPIPKSLLLLGTSSGTDWKHEKTPPKKSLIVPPNPKENKLGPFECMWSLLIGCMKIMVLKL